MQKTYSIRDFNFWRITISLAMASFFIFASMYAVQPLLPVFVTVFNISVSTSSLALSLTIIGLISGLIILGFFSDRMGRTVFINLSLIGSIIPFFLIPLTNSFTLLLIFRLFQGFALAGLPAASLAYLSEEIDRRSVPVATALYISSNAIGGMTGRVLTGYITDYYSWEAAFYAFALIGLVIAVFVFFTLPKSRFFSPTNLSFTRDLKAFTFHLKNPYLLLVFGLGAVLQFSFTGVWTYLPFYLQDPPFSMSLKHISYMFFAYGLGVIGSPLAGWFAGKWGLRPVRISGLIIFSIGILLTLSTTVWVIAAGLCIMCLGFFTAHSLTASTVTEHVDDHKGSASSLYLVAYYIGVALGSSLLSPVWSTAGWTGLVLLIGIIPLVYFAVVQVVSYTK